MCGRPLLTSLDPQLDVEELLDVDELLDIEELLSDEELRAGVLSSMCSAGVAWTAIKGVRHFIVGVRH